MSDSSGRAGVEQTIREMWTTRPHRPDAESKIGGVAAGIGLRYDIDPVLVRVAFVVATVFSGIGVLLYLLCWLLLPAEGDETSPAEGLLGRGRSSQSPTVTVLLGLALLPATGFAFGQQLTGLIGLAVAGAGLFLLHRTRSELGRIPAPPVAGTPPPGYPGDPGSVLGPTATSAAMPGRTATPATEGPTTGMPGTSGAAGEYRTGSPPAWDPPAWDPLGVAPFAWDLPEPGPPPPRAPRPPRPARSKVTAITLGLALLVGGIAAAYQTDLSLAQIAALVLGVVGLGMVVGSLVRGGRGLIGVAIPLVLLIAVLQAVPTEDFTAGDRRWTAATAAQLQPRYELSMGSARLDLSGLRVRPGQTLHTSVAVGIGEARVVLPPGLDARVRCDTPVGAVECLGVVDSGMPAHGDTVDPGSGGSGGGTLVLDVRSGMGNVAVERGP